MTPEQRAKLLGIRTARAYVGELRALDGDNDGELVVEGTVMRSGVWSYPLEDWYGRFIEQVDPSAEIRIADPEQYGDFRLLRNHREHELVARTANDTLTYDITSGSMTMRAVLPDTQVGRDTWTEVRDGYLQGMSFDMSVLDDRWEEGRAEDGKPLDKRYLLEVELFEASLVYRPAYPINDVEARELRALLESRSVGRTNRRDHRDYERELQLAERELQLTARK